jgi:hypothetical protein
MSVTPLRAPLRPDRTNAERQKRFRQKRKAAKAVTVDGYNASNCRCDGPALNGLEARCFASVRYGLLLQQPSLSLAGVSGHMPILTSGDLDPQYFGANHLERLTPAVRLLICCHCSLVGRQRRSARGFQNIAAISIAMAEELSDIGATPSFRGFPLLPLLRPPP